MMDRELSPQRGIALTLLLAALAISCLMPGAARAASVKPQIILDRPLALVGEERPFYVLVRFQVPEPSTARTAKRAPLNIALVLDRSGSMAEGGKLSYAKQAAKMVIDSLQPHDRLALVEYDEVVSVMWPSAPLETPAMIKRLIDELRPRGSTNLSGGMMQGAEQVRRNLDGEAINRVLLLSDGLANAGITDPADIARMAREVRRAGIGISTLGLGLSYNEDLMQDIAENAGGQYHYVEAPEQLAGIFRRELHSLFQTVARDVALVFEAAPAVRTVKVFGAAAESKHGRTLVALENFVAGEQRSLLLRLETSPLILGQTALGTLRLSYEEVNGKTRQQLAHEVTVQVSKDENEVQKAANKEVDVEVAMVEAERRHAGALKTYQGGRPAEARRQMQALATDLAGRQAELGDVRLAKKLEALRIEQRQMQTVASASVSASAPRQAASAYLKASKQRLYQAKKGRRGSYLLREGDKGFEVERLQKALAAAQVYSGPIDGTFGAEISRAVKDYQQRQGISADGIAGPATLHELGIY